MVLPALVVPAVIFGLLFGREILEMRHEKRKKHSNTNKRKN